MKVIMPLALFLVLKLWHTVLSETNIALHKPAEQSSNHNALKWNASAAVDGKLGRDSCAHTSLDGSDAWWRVDLLDTYRVTGVSLYSGEANCGSYFLHITPY